MKILGAEGLFLFNSLDTDHDSYLSPEEFRPIAEKLTGMSSPRRSSFCLRLSPSCLSRVIYTLVSISDEFSDFSPGITSPGEFEEEESHDPNGETLVLEATMQPLQMDSMTKSKDGFLGVWCPAAKVERGIQFSLSVGIQPCSGNAV